MQFEICVLYWRSGGGRETHRINNRSKGKPQYVDLFVRGMSKSLGTSLGHCRVCSFSRFSCGFSTQSFPAPKGTALEFNAVPYQKKKKKTTIGTTALTVTSQLLDLFTWFLLTCSELSVSIVMPHLRPSQEDCTTYHVHSNLRAQRSQMCWLCSSRGFKILVHTQGARVHVVLINSVA